MPALITHNYLARDVFDKLDKKTKELLMPSLDLYYVFCQSFDNFFYYRIPIIIGKKIRKFGYYCQHHNTQSYFINLIRLIKENELDKNSDALAYLYGSITHYVLDSICHPYVFYKTGIFKHTNKDNHKYSGLHAKMEYSLDAYMYTKKNNLPFYKYKFYKDILPKIKLKKEIIKLVSDNYKRTFNKDNMAKYYFKGYKWSRFSYRFFVYDPFGIKKFFYKFFDKITPTKIQKLEYYSFNIKEIDDSYLNKNHQKWYHPSDKKIKFTYSFDDLYQLATNRSLEIINEVNKVLKNKKNIKDLAKVIFNIDYSTGLLLQQNKPMKYFEF